MPSLPPPPGLRLRRHAPRLLAVVACVASSLVVGCASHDQYLVAPEPITALLARPPGAPAVAVPALRARDHRAVFVRSTALDLTAVPLSPTTPSGAITVEARAPRGTCFTVTLPKPQ